jgi:hypothetical protein
MLFQSRIVFGVITCLAVPEVLQIMLFHTRGVAGGFNRLVVPETINIDLPPERNKLPRSAGRGNIVQINLLLINNLAC